MCPVKAWYEAVSVELQLVIALCDYYGTQGGVVELS